MNRGNIWFGKVLLVITLVAALCTLLPVSIVEHKHNLIGYSSLCSFAPISTIVLLLFAQTIWKTRIMKREPTRDLEKNSGKS